MQIVCSFYVSTSAQQKKTKMNIYRASIAFAQRACASKAAVQAYVAVLQKNRARQE